MCTVRRATSEDVAIILKLAQGLFAELGHQVPVDDQHARAFCEAIVGAGEYVALLSEERQGQAIGVITMSEGVSLYAGGRFGVIREFYVIPEERSRGVGKALLERAKEVGREKGWKRIEATPADKVKWPRTYCFYAREGFREIGPRLKLEDLSQK
ncbi:MAG: GNAT family N-acetyltransferase [Phycisphaerae bacterium]|nr:GNAT family N-acetyltransferase [Phycisphaerae bacterium]